jgi:hypothetical protein
MTSRVITTRPGPQPVHREEDRERKRAPCPNCAARLSRRARRDEAGGGLAPPAVHEVLGSPGSPLDARLRADMEPRFRHDFSAVRVHSGELAARSAEAVQALAYTVGTHVVLGDRVSPADRPALAHELAHVVQNGGRQPTGALRVEPAHSPVEHGAENMAQSALGGHAPPAATPAGSSLFRLGANPSCSTGQAATVRQAIYDARSWVNKAVRKLADSPLAAATLRALRHNFGATHGTAANAPTARNRLETARTELGSIPFACNSTDALCTAGHCGFSTAGSHSATICNGTIGSASAVFRAGCVLHESLHAAFPSFTGDSYGGWFGHSSSTAGYPGGDPLNNADSYTMLAMELS